MDTINPINRLILEKNTTQTDVAEKIKMCRQHFNQIVHGKVSSKKGRCRIASHFGVPESKLWPEDAA